MDLGLTLLFLVIIVVAVLDFNSRLKREEQQVRQGGQTGTVAATSSTLAQLQKQKEALTTQVDKSRADMQKLWEENTILTAEIRKKNAEARKLLEDNVALLGQNAALLTQLKQEEQASTDRVPLPSPPEQLSSSRHTEPQSADETPQAKALQQENASLNEQLAQMNTTLQRLYQQKEAQPAGPAESVADQPANPSAPGQPAHTAPPKPARPTLVKEELDALPDPEAPPEKSFWDQMVAQFQERPGSTPAPSTTQSPVVPPVEPAPIQEKAGKRVDTPPVTSQEKRVASAPSVGQAGGRAAPTAAREEEKTAQSAPVPVTPATAPTDNQANQATQTAARATTEESRPQSEAEDLRFWNRLLEHFQEPAKTLPTSVPLPPPPDPKQEKPATVVASRTQSAQRPMTITEEPAAPTVAPAARGEKEPEKRAKIPDEPAKKPEKSVVTPSIAPVPAAKQDAVTTEKPAAPPRGSVAPDGQTVKQPAEPIAPPRVSTAKEPEERRETATTPATDAIPTVDERPEEGGWRDLIASFQTPERPKTPVKTVDKPVVKPEVTPPVASAAIPPVPTGREPGVTPEKRAPITDLPNTATVKQPTPPVETTQATKQPERPVETAQTVKQPEVRGEAVQAVKQPEKPVETAQQGVKQPEKRAETAVSSPESPPVKTVDKSREKGWWSDWVSSFWESPPPAVATTPKKPATGTPSGVPVVASGQAPAATKPTVVASDKETVPPTIAPPSAPSGTARTATQQEKVAPSATLPPAPVVMPKGLPADQAKVVLESVSEGPHALPISTVDIMATRKQLLTRIQQGLEHHKISSEMNAEEGTLYLPGLLDFQNDAAEILPAKRPGIQRLADVLSKELPCFTRQSGSDAGCSEPSRAVKLDALVIVGNSGPAPVGTSTFRHNWNLANTRALQTFAELLKTHPQLNDMRNMQEQSLFRLDGFLPAERTKSTKTKPMQRVELRFIMGPSPLASRPQP